MTPQGHYRATRASGGSPLQAAASMLPDLALLLRPLAPTLAARLHHDPHARARWRLLHQQQDRASHRRLWYGQPEAALLPENYSMLYSGGLDSYIVWQLLGQPPAVYMELGTEAMEKEIAVLPPKVARWRDLSLRNHEQSNGYVPYRNLYLVGLLSAYNPNVVMAMIREWAPDKNRRFFNRLQRLLTEAQRGHFQGLGGERIRILTPFAHLTKTQLVRRYLGGRGRIMIHRGKETTDKVHALLTQTWSCYLADELPCGRCHGCLTRTLALRNNGIYERMQSIPTDVVLRQELRARWNWRDLRIGQLPMYWARWRELQSSR